MNYFANVSVWCEIHRILQCSGKVTIPVVCFVGLRSVPLITPALPPKYAARVVVYQNCPQATFLGICLGSELTKFLDFRNLKKKLIFTSTGTVEVLESWVFADNNLFLPGQCQKPSFCYFLLVFTGKNCPKPKKMHF